MPDPQGQGPLANVLDRIFNGGRGSGASRSLDAAAPSPVAVPKPPTGAPPPGNNAFLRDLQAKQQGPSNFDQGGWQNPGQNAGNRVGRMAAFLQPSADLTQRNQDSPGIVQSPGRATMGGLNFLAGLGGAGPIGQSLAEAGTAAGRIGIESLQNKPLGVQLGGKRPVAPATAAMQTRLKAGQSPDVALAGVKQDVHLPWHLQGAAETALNPLNLAVGGGAGRLAGAAADEVGAGALAREGLNVAAKGAKAFNANEVGGMRFGGQEVNTLKGFDAVIAKQQKALAVLKDAGASQETIAAHQADMENVVNQRAAHLESVLSAADLATYNAAQVRLQGAKDAVAAGSGGAKAPNFGSPAKAEWDSARKAIKDAGGATPLNAAAHRAKYTAEAKKAQQVIDDLEAKASTAPGADTSVAKSSNPELNAKLTKAFDRAKQQRQGSVARVSDNIRGNVAPPAPVTASSGPPPLAPSPADVAPLSSTGAGAAKPPSPATPDRSSMLGGLPTEQLQGMAADERANPALKAAANAELAKRSNLPLKDFPRGPTGQPDIGNMRGPGAVPGTAPDVRNPATATTQPMGDVLAPEGAGPHGPVGPGRGTQAPGFEGMPEPKGPPPLGDNVLGMKDITPGLSRAQRAANVVRDVTRKVSGGIAQPINDHSIAQAALAERQRVKPIIASQAASIGAKTGTAIKRAFVFDKNGGVVALDGIDPTIQGAPAIADIAARLPNYAPHLTPQQTAALAQLEQDLAPYHDLLSKTGVSLDARPDVMKGGFYVPRVVEGTGTPRVSAGGYQAVEKGFEQEATYASQAAGVADGMKYQPIGDAIKSYVQDAGNRALEAHVTNYFKLGRTADGTLYSDIAANERGQIGLVGLAGKEYPLSIANAANKILRSEGPSMGKFSDVVRTANAVNTLLRGVKTTADNSALMIQGLLGLGDDPAAYRQALKVNLKAWGKDGQQALGAYLNQFDAAKAAEGRLTSQQWGRANLKVGGAETEFALGQGVAAKLGALPGIRAANRAFGYFGDTLRLEWADTMLEQEMQRTGKSAETLLQDGTAGKIGNAANRMTGTVNHVPFKDLGDLALFAPRFLQSRLETVAQAVAGLRPGATLEQRMARRALVKLVGLGTGITMAVNYAQGKETDFRPFVTNPKYGRQVNPQFMRMQIGGHSVSAFGTWDSLARSLISLGTGDVAYAYRNQSSPLVGSAWDLISGQNVIGQKTRDNPVDAGKYVMNAFAPISAGGSVGDLVQAGKAAAQGNAQGAATATGLAAFNLMGGKESPISQPKAAKAKAPARPSNIPYRR